MSKYVNATDQIWDTAEVVGHKMERCVLWPGEHEVFTGLFRMPAGMRLPLHHHPEWVQILVMEGKMQVEMKGAEPRVVEQGGYYFVEPGDSHVEMAVEDTVVLVVAQVSDAARAVAPAP